AAPAFAVAPLSVTIGPSRDGTLHDLQRKVDRLVGPGRVNVRTDFIGAHVGDPDPWAWTPNRARQVYVTLVDRKSPHGLVGWYAETGGIPALDGSADGVVFESTRLRGSSTLLRLPATVAKFGFYIEHQGGDEEE